MKKNYGLILAIALGLSALLLTIAYQAGWVKATSIFQTNRAPEPEIISYQGQIWESDIPYTGTGLFKFVILDSKGAFAWSNDGDVDPKPIALQVTNGLFSVLLGDLTISNMTSPLIADVFANPGAVLQVSFSPDGISFTQMPDQKIASVPYALQALFAQDSDLLDGVNSSAFQLRVTGSCSVGQAVRAINANGTVVCETIESKPIYSITSVDSLSSVGAYNSITIGTDGLGLISYHDGTNGALKVAHCKNIACTDFSTTIIDDSGAADVGYSTSIAIGGDGLGMVSYYDTTNGLLKLAHCNNVACDTATITSLGSKGSVSSQGTSIAIGHDGFALISHYQATNQDLQMTRCFNQPCTSRTTYTIDSTGNVGNFSSIIVASEAYVVIAHTDLANWDLRVSYFSIVDLTTKGTTVLDSTGNTGLSPSVTLGVDGLPVISYIDLTDSQLRVAHCTNLICTTFTTDDVLGIPGSSPAISIGSDNMPVISFIETLNNNLEVVKCSNLDCSNVPLYTSVHGPLNGSGEPFSSSITIGMDGFPLISYYNQSTQDLLVAHCSSTNCFRFVRGR